MDEDEFQEVMMPVDITSQRAALILHMSQQIHTIHNAMALEMTLKAIDCLLFSINPPRGEVQEMVKH